MNATRYIIILGLGSLVSLVGCDNQNQPTGTRTPTGTTTQPTNTRTEPDNTGTNKVDRSGDTQTPINQSESSESIKTTADIRRAIMDDGSLSMNAKNTKIITDESGRVTLRGVVNSQAEKNVIDATAKRIAGVAQVDNQLEVKALN